MRRLIDPLLDIIFPKQCLGCKNYDTWACQECLANHLNVETTLLSEPADSWGNIYSITTLGKYSDPFWRQLVALLKFQHISSVAELVGNELALALVEFHEHKQQDHQAPIILPIPLHKTRKRNRGFNQSELIGKKIIAATNWTMPENLLIKTKHTKSQTVVSHSDRQQNVAGSFYVTKKSGYLLTGQTVFLIDDVVTTGSTISAAAKTISHYNPNQISVAAIARGQ